MTNPIDRIERHDYRDPEGHPLAGSVDWKAVKGGNQALADRLLRVVYSRAGGGPSDTNYDPELLETASEAAAALTAPQADDGSRSVSEQLMRWNGIPVRVTGTCSTHPNNWPLIDSIPSVVGESTPSPQADKARGEVELLPLPEPGEAMSKWAYDERDMTAYARANVDRALAESRAEEERLRALLTECIEPVEWAEEQTYSEFSDYAKSAKFGEIRERVCAALSLEPNP